MAKLTKSQLAEKERAIETLREILKPGDTVHCVLRHVSRSGMMRHIDFYALEWDGVKSQLGNDFLRHVNYRWLSRLIATALDYKCTSEGALKVGGCGMDMGFAVVYALSRTLFKDGFACIGEKCPANDHNNGDRDYTPGRMHEHAGGYALRHRWM